MQEPMMLDLIFDVLWWVIFLSAILIYVGSLLTIRR
jgi:hypothetical protein